MIPSLLPLAGALMCRTLLQVAHWLIDQSGDAEQISFVRLLARDEYCGTPRNPQPSRGMHRLVHRGSASMVQHYHADFA